MISEEKKLVTKQIESQASAIEQDGIKLRQYAENITTEERIETLKEAIEGLTKEITGRLSEIAELAKKL
ncbi:hypothetical protein KY319_01315 [Candidatus Woesearchaeota archaeon]|nr:hypothetical protein [Candidatus Woesearchaeota archaeon]